MVGVIEDDVLLDKRKFIRLNGVGLVVGISIFLNTETGIYMIVAVAGSFFVFHALNKKFWLKGFVVGSSALLMFLVLSFAFYGRGIFTSRFVVGILEVLFAFGSGFGDIPMVWGELQSVLYNTLTPMVSLASLGWIFATRTQRDSSISMQQKGYLAIFSILSILFLIKYINRAFQQNWLVASINTLIVISWWLYFFMKGLFVEFRDARNELVETSQLGSAYYIMALLLLYSCLLFFSYASVNIGDVLVINVAADGEEFPVIEEAPIGVRAFGYWPSLVRSVFLESNILEQNVAQMRYQVEPAQVDIDLIEGLLEPRERVSVFAENDFAYYLALRRASQFGYIPSKETVFDYYTDIWLNEQARLVFVESVPKRIAPEIHWTLKTNYLGYRPDIGGRIKVYARIEPGNEIIYTPLDQEMSNSLDGLLSRGDIMCENRLIYPSGVMNDSPVLDLPSGDYQINFWLSIADNKSNGGVVMIAITSEMGDLIKPREIFAHEFLESGQFQLFSVHLDLLDRMNGIEFIVEPMGKTKIFLEKIIIVRNDR